MSANQACFPIAAMARVLGVSKAGYYAWLQRPPSARATADAALLKRIKTVHASSRQTYGAPRVRADLHGHGERHSRKRIARLMREAGLVGASHRHGSPTTTRRNKDDRPAPDLVDRDFNAAGPNQLWVADITYVPTMAGFLYHRPPLSTREMAGCPARKSRSTCSCPIFRCRSSMTLCASSTAGALLLAPEQLPRTLHQLLLPIADHCRMNPKIHRQLSQGLLLRKRRHRHSRLKFRAVLFPLDARVSRPFGPVSL